MLRGQTHSRLLLDNLDYYEVSGITYEFNDDRQSWFGKYQCILNSALQEVWLYALHDQYAEGKNGQSMPATCRGKARQSIHRGRGGKEVKMHIDETTEMMGYVGPGSMLRQDEPVSADSRLRRGRSKAWSHGWTGKLTITTYPSANRLSF